MTSNEHYHGTGPLTDLTPCRYPHTTPEPALYATLRAAGATVTPIDDDAPEATSTCIDCSTSTFGVPHGAGADHSPAARACTAQAQARAFAAEFPTPNVLRAIDLAEQGRVTWEQIVQVFKPAVAAALRLDR